MTYQMGYRFALEKQDWIIEHAKILQERKNTAPLIHENSQIKTRYHKVVFERHQLQHVVSKKDEDLITLYFPESAPLESDANQQLIKGFVNEVLRTEAKLHLPKRVDELAAKYGFSFQRVYVKNLKSRWGSCSSKNNINLNIQLMRLPEHLSDFIILHELCHTRYKNHGPLFHAMLNQLCGDEKALNKELRKYSTQF